MLFVESKKILTVLKLNQKYFFKNYMMNELGMMHQTTIAKTLPALLRSVNQFIKWDSIKSFFNHVQKLN